MVVIIGWRREVRKFSIIYDDTPKFLTPKAIDELSDASGVFVPRVILKFYIENLSSVMDTAIDNFNQNEETVHEEHTTHAIAVVLY